MENTTYSVATTGVIKSGHDRADVATNFAKLFNITPEKANALVGVKKVLKKDIDKKRALAYKQKLEAIGLEVQLQQHNAPAENLAQAAPLSLAPSSEEPTPESKPGLSLAPIEAPASAGGLALAPIDGYDPAPAQESPNPPQNAFPTSDDPDLIICPKCHLEQPVENEECEGCGVFMRKLQAKMAAEVEETAISSAPAAQEPAAQGFRSRRQSRLTEEEQAEVEAFYGDKFNVASLIAGGVAAFLGALVWKFVAIWFGIEHGIIAWAIGGAIGFAAAIVGGQGQVSGIVCAGLAVCAIIGGKYMAVQSFKDNPALMFDAISEAAGISMEDYLPQMYEEDMRWAKQYDEDVYDEQSLRQFLVDSYYAETDEADEVTTDEIEYFRQFDEPRLKMLVSENPSYEEWKDSYLKYYFEDQYEVDLETGQVNEQSDLQFVLGNLDFIDIIFLFLGVYTAFKLGSGYRFGT